ncbi:MAG: GNAT family N-acetyltransferase [Gammaproteobacteria bacterium]|nr:MAG: GNAT family N-acetyltransferase [Gammaproteobacteria bacterium]
MNITIDFKSYDPLTEITTIKNIWSFLLPNCSHSFFLSIDWIFTWLSTLPEQQKITCVVGYMSNKPVLAFFIGERRVVRNKLFHSQGLYLNTTGIDDYDELTIEYNSILISSSINEKMRPIVWSETIKYLDTFTTWDELYIPGATEKMRTLCSEVIKIHKDTLVFLENKNVNSYYVDLKKIRTNSMDYIGLLSSKFRARIRRSIREYEKNGEIRMSQPETIEDAISMLNGLAELHQQEWKKRGHPGSFSNNFFFNFHKQLIENTFEKGNIQLLKFYNDSYTIGYIYNFIYGENILNYQCGFNYSDNHNMRPGIVSHYLAIIYNAKMNYRKYDFLAGDYEYKRSLSTDANKMLWLVLQKNRKRFLMEKILKYIKNTIK